MDRSAKVSQQLQYAAPLALTAALSMSCTGEVSSPQPTEAPVARTSALDGLAGCDSASGNWASYGQGVHGRRCVSGDDLPTAANAALLKVQWENGTAGTTSTPIISNGRAYYGDYASNFYAVQHDTGEVKWTVNLKTPFTVRGDDPIRSSAAVDGQDIYVSTSHTLYKLTKKGKVVWSHLMDTHYSLMIDSSPTVVDGIVLLGVSGFEDTIPSERSFRGSVVAVDAETGDELWRTYTTSADENSGPGVSVWGTAVVDEEARLAYVGTGNAYEEPAAPLSDSLLALDLDTGEVVWQQQFVEGDIYNSVEVGPGPDSDIGASPVLFELDGTPVVGVGCKSGEYKVFDRISGEELLAVQLLTATVYAQQDPTIPDWWGTAYSGGIVGSQAVADGVLYVVSNLWWFYDFWNIGVNNPTDTSVAYAIDLKTGTVKWLVQMPAPHFGGVTKINDAVYFGLLAGLDFGLGPAPGSVVGLNAADGSYVFYSDLPGPAGGGVSAQGSRLFVGYGFAVNPVPYAPSGVRAYSLDGLPDDGELAVAKQDLPAKKNGVGRKPENGPSLPNGKQVPPFADL